MRLIKSKSLLLAFILTFGTAPALEAKNRKSPANWQRDYGEEYYSKHLFKRVDLDQDSLLSILELKQHKFWKLKLEQADFFPTCDRNHDYRLSLHEIQRYLHMKQIQRTLAEIRIYKSLVAKVGRQLWNCDWITRNPSIAKQLTSNRYFLCKHPRTARELAKHKGFASQLPVLHAKLQEHQKWVLYHPKLAKNLVTQDENSLAEQKQDKLSAGDLGTEKLTTENSKAKATRAER